MWICVAARNALALCSAGESKRIDDRYITMPAVSESSDTSAPAAKMLAGVASWGFILFLATATAVQLMHPHGMAVTPISAYLRGAHSGWLQAAYYVLSSSLILSGVSLNLVPGPRRQAIAGGLLVIAGCAVTLVAYSYSPWPMPGDPTHHTRESIHVKSAFVAFLAVTIVMFIEIPLRWRRRARMVMWTYAASVLGVELASLPGSEYTPHLYGALEKLAIVGLVIWLIVCSRAIASPGVSRAAGGR